MNLAISPRDTWRKGHPAAAEVVMLDRRIIVRFAAVLLLFSAAIGFAASAEAKTVPGLPGVISDCVPGATNCGKGDRPFKVGDRVRHHGTPPKSARFKVGDRVRRH